MLFVVLTDGEENSSREFDQRQVFDMIRERQERGYEFIYLGANQDSYAVSESLGIAKGRARNYAPSPEGMREVLADVACNTSAYRRRGATKCDDFFTPQMREEGRER